ncbi:MAG: C40 family peptidase [Lutibacter sp.]|nr:C40 family peptidase [Lutibacter sp.]
MTSKKKHLSKFAVLIGLSVIVLGTRAYCSSRVVDRLTKKDETIVKSAPIKNNVSLEESIVSYGMELLGTPYVESGCSKDGFDCSGFVYYVFKHFKIQVPRSSSQFKDFGTEIPINSVRKGDILVFLSPTRNVIGHVGIVTNPKGMESDFIHASSGREMKVIVTNLKKEGYTRRFVKAIRVL